MTVSLLQHCVALSHGQGASHLPSELTHSLVSSRALLRPRVFVSKKNQQQVHRTIQKASRMGSEQQALEATSVSGGNATFESGLVGLVAAVCASLCLPMSSNAMWDGTSAAIGSCPLGEAGQECRTRALSKDKMGDYSKMGSNSTKMGSATTLGVPVANLDTGYASDSKAVGEIITKYITMDMYDPERAAVAKNLKKESLNWVSKYARGGSARTVSARKMYVAVDAIQGHLASNGFAPFPKNKSERVLQDIQDALSLLEQGKK
eukprot:jgi/Picsp_1/3369/NSC_06207-R1_protein